jgi:hypothetical protein
MIDWTSSKKAGSSNKQAPDDEVKFNVNVQWFFNVQWRFLVKIKKKLENHS